MSSRKPSAGSQGIRIVVSILFWAAAAWLIYPLIVLDSVDAGTSIPFFYRAAAGIVLLIILFGKTLLDLLDPRGVSARRTALSVVLMSLYVFALAGGIIFMIVRILLLSLNKNAASLLPK
jgi:succinate dehydrogenase/fumarate reductase cytochrome b subunit